MSWSQQDQSGLQVTLEAGIVEVGSRISGHLSRAGELGDLATDEQQRVRAVELSLGWKTSGRGNRYEETLEIVTFPVDRWGRVDTTFELAVPARGPISYDGRLIRIEWTLEAKVDIKMRRDHSIEIPILIVPSGGWGIYDKPHPLYLRR